MQVLMRIAEVQKLTRKSRPAIYQASRTGGFPKSVKIANRSLAWIESEVHDWLAARIAERG